jgi:hypothetical protein
MALYPDGVSPHQIKKDRKGKARVKVMAEDPQPMSPADGDATDEDVRELRSVFSSEVY